MSKHSHPKPSDKPGDEAPLRKADLAAGKLVPRKRAPDGAVLPEEQCVNGLLGKNRSP